MISLRNKKPLNFVRGIKKLRPVRTPTTWWSALDWPNLIALLVTLGIAIWSVDQARWIKPSTSLTAVLVVSVITGFILVKTGLRDVFIHPLAFLIGLVVIFCQGLLLMPDPVLGDRVLHLVSDLQAWWYAQVYGAPSPVTLHIALIFGYITWLTGWFSTWSLLKKSTPWVSIILGLIVVLVNLNFWSRDKYYYFVVYVIAALVFLSVFTYLKHRSQLARSGFPGGRSSPFYWLAISLCVIVISVSVAWVNPGFKIGAISTYARSHDPFKGPMELYWESFFAPVPGSKVAALSHGGQQDLNFGGPLQLSDQVVFILNSNQPYYWKTQVYDFYTSTGWKTDDTQPENIEAASPVAGNVPSAPDGEFVYTVIPQMITDVLPTMGEFVSANLPVKEKVLVPQVFTINFLDPSSDSQLPPDIAAAAVSIRLNGLRNRRRTDQQIAALLPSDLKIENITRSTLTPLSITVSRVEAEDRTSVALSSAQLMLQQKRATIAVIPPPVVTDALLAAAGNVYPKWVTDRYLQLPSSLPDRVRKLAAGITKNSTSPFQKALDIKKYLGTLTYDLSITAPPDGEDGVDYLLFTSQAGYCNYFASAAAVMLRSVGVPARMVVGFMPGQLDSATHNYIIRDRDYHAWIEIYYPGEGWVSMDVTPAAQTASRSSGNTPAQQDLPYPLFPVYPGGGEAGSSPSTPLPARSNSFTNLILFMVAYVLIVAFILGWFQFSSRPKNRTSIYSRMVLLASLGGIGPKPRQTELEFSRQLALALPRQAEAISGITSTYMRYRYSREVPDRPMDVEFKKTWPALRLALIKRIFRLK